MLVSDYDKFVKLTDQSLNKSREVRLDIATYGLASEIGSVVSAIKKRLLAEGGEEQWNVANEEIVEELGDVVWYCFSLAGIANPEKPVNIFAHDIANLKREIGGDDPRANRIRGVLDPLKREEFLRAAESFPKRTKLMQFDDYQSTAFLTARTEPRTLVVVCLAVLWQLSAQLFRRKLPSIELELNTALVDRPINDILGEIAWHVAALASIYTLKLGDIAQKNIEKVSFRLDRAHPTPLHDEGCLSSQRFPRQFEVAFVTISKGRSRMYLNGRRLGDDLTDNAYDEDGYRFHDVMHIANAAKLGWSPVLRDLMKRKRKADPKVDEVEDGARARIVEEAIVKAVHSEGKRLAEQRGRREPDTPLHLFPDRSEITFRFLKFIHSLVAGIEAVKNRYWEWEDAIVCGQDLFYRLRCEEQGTVVVDLTQRSISFKPEVCVRLTGKVAGIGSARLAADELKEELRLQGQDIDCDVTAIDDATRVAVIKRAVLGAAGIEPTELHLSALQITELNGNDISVKALGPVREAFWNRSIISFSAAPLRGAAGEFYCTVIALTDDVV
jgi:NTP pyrophosphatase (non-canonical NTP hydrolase)